YSASGNASDSGTMRAIGSPHFEAARAGPGSPTIAATTSRALARTTSNRHGSPRPLARRQHSVQVHFDPVRHRTVDERIARGSVVQGAEQKASVFLAQPVCAQHALLARSASTQISAFRCEEFRERGRCSAALTPMTDRKSVV